MKYWGSCTENDTKTLCYYFQLNIKMEVWLWKKKLSIRAHDCFGAYITREINVQLDSGYFFESTNYFVSTGTSRLPPT